MKIRQAVKNVHGIDIKALEELGIGIEIQEFCNTDVLDGDWQAKAAEYKEKLHCFKGGITFHAASIDLNPGSPDKKIAELTKDRYIKSIDIARELKADSIVFHSQINPFLREPRVRDIKINRQAEFWQDILEDMKGYDPVILIENVFEHSFEDLCTLVEKINHPRVRLCIDAGHILTYSDVELEKWIKETKQYIDVLHFHWNDGFCDAHQSPTNEFISRFDNILKRENISPIVTLEYRIDDIKLEIQRIKSLL